MKVPNSFYNWLSLTGFVIGINSLILMLFLRIITLFYKNPYSSVNIYIYVILPFSLISGLVLILTGMFIRMRRRKKGEKTERTLPVIDFNERADRVLIAKLFMLVLIFLVASVIGSFEANRYTNSSEFCGTLCHTVMEPEYSTYLTSSHARVPCLGCHAGFKAGWYAQSRLSLLKMVYSYFSKGYSIPIPGTTETMRPERKACEGCHWPQKFYTRKLVNIVRYMADSANTEWNISLMLKVGPKKTSNGLKEGIHWHINPDTKIEYITTDPEREIILWIRYTNLKTGNVKVFTDPGLVSARNAKTTGHPRTMDCMDCHNRPSHLFKTASDYIDQAMSSGMIPPELPYIKKAAMAALKDPYNSVATAMGGIRSSITDFYSLRHHTLWMEKKAMIEAAIRNIQQEYSKNNFPAMKVDGYTHPNHISHFETDGCFRCHSGNYRTSSGEVISSDCNLCHTIIEQGTSGKPGFTMQRDSLVFVHPTKLKDGTEIKRCSGCHRTI